MGFNEADDIEWIERECHRFQKLWEDGGNPKIEDFLASAPESLRLLLFEELLDLEIHLRRDSSIAVQFCEYVRRFPEYYSEIRDCFYRLETVIAPRKDSAEEPQPSDSSEKPPMHDKRYYLRRKLGGGAFGEVWQAWDRRLSRNVAIKIPKVKSCAILDLFVKEARTLAGLDPGLPHIVVIHDLNTDAETPFLVMEYVAGISLGAALRKHGPITWDTVAQYACDTSRGLEALHERGIVHRDIKPDNLVLRYRNNQICLVDFGVATPATDVTNCAWTWGFVAPEVFSGFVTTKNDVFSLSATMFKLLTNDRPFHKQPKEEYSDAVRRGLPDGDPRIQGLSPAARSLLRDGLKFAPDQRPNLYEFQHRLIESLDPRRRSAVSLTQSHPIVLPAKHETRPLSALELKEALIAALNQIGMTAECLRQLTEKAADHLQEVKVSEDESTSLTFTGEYPMWIIPAGAPPHELTQTRPFSATVLETLPEKLSWKGIATGTYRVCIEVAGEVRKIDVEGAECAWPTELNSLANEYQVNWSVVDLNAKDNAPIVTAWFQILDQDLVRNWQHRKARIESELREPFQAVALAAEAVDFDLLDLAIELMQTAERRATLDSLLPEVLFANWQLQKELFKRLVKLGDGPETHAMAKWANSTLVEATCEMLGHSTLRERGLCGGCGACGLVGDGRFFKTDLQLARHG